jgi:hypothetical protein
MFALFWPWNIYYLCIICSSKLEQVLHMIVLTCCVENAIKLLLIQFQTFIKAPTWNGMQNRKWDAAFNEDVDLFANTKTILTNLQVIWMLYQARAVTIELVSLNHLQKIQIDAKVDKRKKQSKCYLAAKCFFLSCLAYCNHCQACCLLSLFILNIHISPLKLKVYRKYIWQLRLEILFVWKFNVFAN